MGAPIPETLEYPSTSVVAAGEGVYYDRAASPGVFVRLLISAVDLIAVLALGAALDAAWFRFVSSDPLPGIAYVLLWWGYLVGVKATPWGTLGYLLFRARVRDLRGRPAGLLRLTLRSVVAVFFNPLVDLFWAAGDESRQTLRDKICGTYVVRRSAQPAGRGEFAYANLFFLGMNLVFKEVRRH